MSVAVVCVERKGPSSAALSLGHAMQITHCWPLCCWFTSLDSRL